MQIGIDIDTHQHMLPDFFWTCRNMGGDLGSSRVGTGCSLSDVVFADSRPRDTEALRSIFYHLLYTLIVYNESSQSPLHGRVENYESQDLCEEVQSACYSIILY